MNVLYASDDGYAAVLGTSLLSLCENNRELEELHIFLLDGGICEENHRRLDDIAERYGRSLTWIRVDGYENEIMSKSTDPDDRMHQLDAHGYNPIVYVRLLMEDYLPQTVSRVLYLDCDTIIDRPLKLLEDERYLQYLVKKQNSKQPWLMAAVPELYMPPEIKKQTIGFERDETYYNAGVLFINLEQWRKEKIKGKLLGYWRKNKERLWFNDQDILNSCCKGRILTLPQAFDMNPNLPFFPRWYMKKIQPAYYTEPAIWVKMIRHPVIIHFMGDERPWIAGNKNYYRKKYEQYLNKTPWRDNEMTVGREKYMRLYHMMNLMTRFCPYGRMLLTNLIGIRLYRMIGKQ